MAWSAPQPDLTGRILRHERALVGASLAGLAAFGWWYVAAGPAMAGSAQMAIMRLLPLGALVIMWWLMMVAMMLPSAAPAVLLYSRVREMRGPDAIADTWLFLAGYLVVWLLFSIAAAIAQTLMVGIGLGNHFAGGAVLLAAGVYQLLPLKSACIRQCRSPAEFISRHWRPGMIGAVQLGLRHGVYCLGCCWMLMALFFVGGVMNLLWMIALTILVGIEKLAPGGAQVSRAVGVVLAAWGMLKIAGY